MTSTIKVNTIQNTCGADIIKESGNTITIGASGDTVTLGSGASQSGFGRTGAVNWQTTKKTANFTASSGEGYFCDTAAVGSFTLTLPSSPSAGDIVGLKDYNGNFSTANLIIGRGGSNLDGNAGDKTLNTDNLSLTLVYVDATQGWVPIEEGTGFIGQAPAFIAATGGTVTTVCTNFKVHTFTGPGTFCVSCAGNALGSNKVSYMVVAGGGEGGSAAPSNGGGGGGAGGYRESKSPFCSYTASPTASTCGLAVTGAIPITVGAGGAQQPQPANTAGNDGSNSIFSTITSAGGGGGKIDSPAGTPTAAGDGGSGGGGAASSCSSSERRNGGTGNTPPVSPSQGNDGGSGGPSGAAAFGGGGGGGAGAAGGNNSPSPAKAGNGGCGVASSINATPTTRAGGGGGASTHGPTGSGGRGLAGPGGGGIGGFAPNGDGGSGTANTGGGGGAGGHPAAGSARGGGGSGIVIIRYKFQ